ncbi:GNAT family N-acetyltransferase [Leptodesmis sichuanensis]|uniref:GNAT family N-acetyltransferase n=1 Tax=Leptodesmis sichuanensis TaxID=2906798 RepID=UPI001F1C1300|nr:GNAT family N-acetyltransferase [Leptodesmis sichuanensis]UIE36338.1 GNAT family N-acetyltransferase [Leptodesmis sichuanensis A121]
MTNLIIRSAQIPKELPQVYKIRYLVFQIEQGVDPTLEFDGKDERAHHLIAFLGEKAVGTARIRFLEDQTAKVERVAVLPEVRGQGIGRKLMDYIEAFLVERQVTEVYMHAQEPVREFYQKLGYVPEGRAFEEAGIPHIAMRKLLR